MNETLKIQISAFVDGELPENEAELLLRRLCREDQLRAEVDRYLTIGRAIRGEVGVLKVRAVRDRVAAELGDLADTAIDAVPASQSGGGRFFRPLAGVAIAASVAVLALFGLRQQNVGTPTGVDAIAELQDAIAIEDALTYTEPPATVVTSDKPSERLTQYLVHHGLRSPNISSRLTSVAVRRDELETADGPGEADDPETAPEDREAE